MCGKARGVSEDDFEGKNAQFITPQELAELVVATNPTLEGEATAMYIRRHQGRDDLRITHLARGLPVGGSLEYTDETTLTRAFQGRQEI